MSFFSDQTEELLRLKRERAVAMRCVAAVLSKENQNVLNDDLVGSINDLAQIKVSAINNYNELLTIVRKLLRELPPLID